MRKCKTKPKINRGMLGSNDETYSKFIIQNSKLEWHEKNQNTLRQ